MAYTDNDSGSQYNSFEDRRKMFKSIFSTPLSTDQAMDLKKKVTNYIHVEDRRHGKFETKAEKIKNLRTVCTNILKVCDKESEQQKTLEKKKSDRSSPKNLIAKPVENNHFQVVQAWPVLATPVPVVLTDKPATSPKKKLKKKARTSTVPGISTVSLTKTKKKRRKLSLARVSTWRSSSKSGSKKKRKSSILRRKKKSETQPAQ